ncbi:uncharacterized protein LOC112600338 [Melanaphis sacchari]|uniref:uncharacterized protein LOC112600338 n=1 Tax=Melanaphis sacchari TaxID=742174 RepID=UPI000DC15173|nr:uncharacterized protein LOC112600338 [Melanaphis sacchari]
MNRKKVVTGVSEDEFGVNDPIEVTDSSDDEWIPTTSNTLGKRTHPTKNKPDIKKNPKILEDKDKVEILTKKEKETKPRIPLPPLIPISVRGLERATKIEVKKEKLESEDDEDEDLGEEEEHFYKDKPDLNAFVVLKVDMICEENPLIWKIDDEELLQKYAPFKKGGKILYKNTPYYISWNYNVRELYYSAPSDAVLCVQRTNKKHVVEFYKDKIKIDPKIEEAFKNVIEEESVEIANKNLEYKCPIQSPLKINHIG